MGDILDVVMAQWKAKQKAAQVNGEQAGSGGGGAKPDSDGGSKADAAATYDPMYRPWDETLPINKAKWTEFARKGISIHSSPLGTTFFSQQMEHYCGKIGSALITISMM